MSIETILDLKGFTCPVPLLRTKKTLKKMAEGDIVKLLITDPNTKSDLSRFCQRASCRLVNQLHESDHDIFIIEKMAQGQG